MPAEATTELLLDGSVAQTLTRGTSFGAGSSPRSIALAAALSLCIRLVFFSFCVHAQIVKLLTETLSAVRSRCGMAKHGLLVALPSPSSRP